MIKFMIEEEGKSVSDFAFPVAQNQTNNNEDLFSFDFEK